MNWKDQERIKLLIPSEDITSILPNLEGKSIDIILESELYMSTTEKKRPTIRMFYEAQLRLDDYIDMLHRGGFNILTYLSTDIEAQDNIYDFSNSNVIEFRKNNGKWEQGRAYMEIILDQLSTQTNNRSSQNHGDINYSVNSSYIVDDIYRYEAFNFENEKKFEAISKSYPSHIQFGEFQIEILPEFELSGQSHNKFEVTRYARLEINKLYVDEYDDINEIRLTSRLLTNLINLYFSTSFDQVYSRYHLHSATTIDIVNDGKSNSVTIEEDKFIKGHDNVLEFLGSINAHRLNGHEEFLIQIVKQYVFSTQLNLEAEFMILYNIIEQFRNYYIKMFEPRRFTVDAENYKTVGSKKSANKFIKERIKCIVSVIHEDDRKEFLENASNKISFMKKKQMNNQISMFLDDISIQYSKEVLSGLLKLRNKVYHGSIAVGNKQEVLTSVEELKNIIQLIFKDFLGLEKNAPNTAATSNRA